MKKREHQEITNYLLMSMGGICRDAASMTTIEGRFHALRTVEALGKRAAKLLNDERLRYAAKEHRGSNAGQQNGAAGGGQGAGNPSAVASGLAAIPGESGAEIRPVPGVCYFERAKGDEWVCVNELVVRSPWFQDGPGCCVTSACRHFTRT
jgi:hypothetical protein